MSLLGHLQSSSTSHAHAWVARVQIRKRLGRRALRSVILYDGNGGAKPSPWMRHLSKLFLKDGKALTVTVLQGGYRSFAERYAFAVHRDPDAQMRSYPSEVIR